MTERGFKPGIDLTTKEISSLASRPFASAFTLGWGGFPPPRPNVKAEAKGLLTRLGD